MNETEVNFLPELEQLYTRARSHGASLETIDQAIEEFREVVAKSRAFDKPLFAGIALTDLGAQLVNRAWMPPNLIRLQDAVEAEDVLTQALQALATVSNPSRETLEANALAWRARARTFLAEKDRAKNDAGIKDAGRAINILTAQPRQGANPHDLAIAHLHMARALFFRVATTKRSWLFGASRRLDVENVRKHSSEALALDPDDHHIKVQAGWLYQNADRV